jgi:hypothetical protein
MTDLAIIIPMLGRPHHIPPLLESIEKSTPAARVLFMVSPSDGAVHDMIDAHRQAGVTVERHTIPYSPIGDYARKINTAYRFTTEPLLFLGASDLYFHDGWYENALAQLTPGVGVVGTNDLGSPRVMRGEHSTHSLVTRRYVQTCGTIDQPETVLCELYWHEYVDDEFINTAKYRRAYAHASESIVEHLHPNWGKGETDPLYAAQQSRMVRGYRIYQRRRHLWT